MYPRLFQFGPFTLPTYGVFAAVGLVAGLTLAARTAARLGIGFDRMWSFSLTTVLSAILGARVLLIAGNWRDFLSYPMVMLSIAMPRTIGLMLTEIGLGVTAGLLYMTVNRMPWLRTLDAAAPGWAFGQAMLAMGCFFAGCNYGAPTAEPWGVTFHSRWAAMWNGTPLGIKLQPVQIYAALIQIALTLLLLVWLPRVRQSGELAGIWMFLSGLTGFYSDFFRGDNRLLILKGALSLTQAIDFCLVVVGALLLLERSKKSFAQGAPPGEAKQ
ncbi:MAG TPA: prolipoprotein diacylglyceryl transferase family protein [Acidobacteriaceae bacterium]|nr:prolipoprotein diacylglyceryl transferase family protein [Acidobacteriaceae bacterium]